MRVGADEKIVEGQQALRDLKPDFRHANGARVDFAGERSL